MVAGAYVVAVPFQGRGIGSALLPALWMVQDARGWVSEAGMAEASPPSGARPANPPFDGITFERDKMGVDGTTYQGIPGARAAFSSWRTTQDDVEIAWRALEEAAASV